MDPNIPYIFRKVIRQKHSDHLNIAEQNNLYWCYNFVFWDCRLTHLLMIVKKSLQVLFY